MAELSSRQLSEWEAYDRLDPIASWRDDFRTAQLMALIVNLVTRIFHDKKKGPLPKETVPLDFMPDWSGQRAEVPKTQSVEEMKSILLNIASTHNKRIKVKGQKRPPPPKRKRHGNESGNT